MAAHTHDCAAMGKRIAAFYMHNNDGREDKHNWLDDGTMDMSIVQKILSMYSNQADFVLEYAKTAGKTARDLLCDAALLAPESFR